MMNLPSAAMMHNLGLARLLAYEHGPHPKQNTNLLQGAFCSLSSAHSLILKHTAEQPAIANIDIFYDRLRPMLLDAVVLSNLFRVLWHASQTDAADEVMTALTNLLDDIQIYQDHLLSMNVEVGNHKLASAA
jgi:hypothetical protein